MGPPSSSRPHSIGGVPAPRRPISISHHSSNLVIPPAPSASTLHRTEEGSSSAGSGGGRNGHGSYFPPAEVDDATGKARQRPVMRRIVSLGREVGTSWNKTWEIEGARGLSSRAYNDLLQSRTRFNKLPQSLKALIVASILALAYFTFPSFRSTSSTPARSAAPFARAVLSSPGEPQAMIDRARKPKSRNQAKTVESHSNPYGFVNAIESRMEGVFSPSVLALPEQIGPAFRYVVVARQKGREEVIDGEVISWRSLVGGMMNERRGERLQLPFLTREMGLSQVDLPTKRTTATGACDDPDFDRFVGPEDPKLFLTNDGTPLLFYTQSGTTSAICRGPAVIDARVPFPALGAALRKVGWNPPLTFAAQTALVREGQANVEKNWVPFLGERDELWVAASAVPQLMYKYVPGEAPLQAVNPGASYSNCITKVVGEHLDRAYHHATPLLRVTLCGRGECVPDRRNTVLFGIVHVKFPQEYAWYERRVVTYSINSPYQILSVSKPIMYSGTNQADPIITTTIAWMHPTVKDGGGLNHGFLDDVVMTSYGAHDFQANYIDVLARDLLSEHTLCEGV